MPADAPSTEPANRRLDDCHIFPIVRRRPVSLDSAEVPCRDCHVGEPHVCPLLYWDTLTVQPDEWGGYAITSP